ncbi:MAG TPA: 23S rRNA (adenine(2503)-C(2))-methyltransferase RlmN [Terriglobales bacterium]|nr:23S rRNA (adenine(2503)-C(2))-methyltransferase RlmN [Terriglobales bacterium]
MSKPQHTELLGLCLQQLTDVTDRFGEPPYRARQLFDGLYRQRWSQLEQFSPLPADFRRRLHEAGYSVGLPRSEARFLSEDGTVRYLLAFADGQSVETVWMPEGDGGEAGDGSASGDEELESKTWSRATICVSSQVGCAVDCKFCMTALLGLLRNLTAGEILGQILAVMQDQQVDLERDRLNLVFMGQGEPFLNYDNFMQAVRLLVDGVGFTESRMTVSTSGIVPRIADFAAEAVRPKLAVSLNAANEALRTQIMPITKKWTIEKLIASLRNFPLRNRERLTFEYVLLNGVNDEAVHAREVAELIRGLRAKINLIALNSGPDIPFSTPAADRVLAFQRILRDAGIPAFIRRPRGRDIYAACGQLKHTTELVGL